MFEIIQTFNKARVGKLYLHHGVVDTPVFMPVATMATIKSITPEDLLNFNTQIILSNTYHLFLRPGLDVIKKFSGLHNFMQWQRPILTDSGGFQIFSLARLNKVNENGVIFQNHIDGAEFFLTPKLAVEIQETLGSDIHMVLDQCAPYPISYDKAKEAMLRSLKWAQECKCCKTKDELYQFGIIQGSVFEDLRKISCEQTQKLNFDGYAIGGLSVGEPKELMREMTKICCENLDSQKPRYLMGVGTPLDLIESVALGVDMFDCVMPTRNARRGTLFTSQGRINIKNEIYKYDESALDPKCDCYTCKTYSKAYLRYLYKYVPLTSHRLLSLHNLRYYIKLMEDIRESIRTQTFNELLLHHQSLWKN